jgi:hypothetical protein
MSETTKTLHLKFGTDEGKSATISINHCKDNVTAQEAQGAMDTMIANPIFTFGLSEKLAASVVERTVTELF